mmetsp:Transcript_3322/g.11495  ORF Transcript_3322/g.11495 Transcript_3322/m.11495 type:complete len:257 (+) Transcript_3322:174-944(+)
MLLWVPPAQAATAGAGASSSSLRGLPHTVSGVRAYTMGLPSLSRRMRRVGERYVILNVSAKGMPRASSLWRPKKSFGLLKLTVMLLGSKSTTRPVTATATVVSPNSTFHRTTFSTTSRFISRNWVAIFGDTSGSMISCSSLFHSGMPRRVLALPTTHHSPSHDDSRQRSAPGASSSAASAAPTATGEEEGLLRLRSSRCSRGAVALKSRSFPRFALGSTTNAGTATLGGVLRSVAVDSLEAAGTAPARGSRDAWNV